MNSDFSTFKLAVVITVALVFMKIMGWIDVSTWVVFLPIFIVLGIGFFIVFLIGLVTIYLVSQKMDEDTEESENEA